MRKEPVEPAAARDEERSETYRRLAYSTRVSFLTLLSLHGMKPGSSLSCVRFGGFHFSHCTQVATVCVTTAYTVITVRLWLNLRHRVPCLFTLG